MFQSVLCAMFARMLILGPLLVLGLAAPVQGAPLVLGDVLTAATAHDARRAILDEDLRIQELSATEQTLTLLPQARVSAQVLRNPREVKVGEPPDERVVVPLLVPGASGAIDVILFDAPKVPAAVAQWQRARALDAQNEEQRDAYLHDVAQRFLALAEAQALRDAYQTSAGLTDELLRIAERRLALGDATLSDVADAKSEQARLRAEAAANVTAEGALWQALALVTGLDPSQVPRAQCDACVAPRPQDGPPARLSGEAAAGMALSPPMTPPPALRYRGDLEALARTSTAERIEEASAWSRLLPTVGAALDAQLSQPTLFRPETLWWTARVTLSWELFSGGTDVAAALRHDRIAARAELLEAFARRQSSAEVAAANAVVQAQRIRVDAEKARREAAQTALDLAQKQYAGGVISGREVTERSQAHAAAVVAAIRAEYALYRARLAARQAEGKRPLDDGERYDGAS